MLNTKAIRLCVIGLVVLGAPAACSINQLGPDYTGLAHAPGDRIHSISVSDFGLFRYVRADSIVVSDHELDESELLQFLPSAGEGRMRLELRASPQALRVIEATDAKKDVEELLLDYFDRAIFSSYAPPDPPVFEVVLLRSGEGISLASRAWSLSRIRIPVLVQLKSSSREALLISIASSIPTIGHELVHLSARAGILTFPGADLDEAMLNEEIFASLVEICHRYENMLAVQLGEPLTIKLHPVRSQYPDDADAHFEALKHIGPSLAGKFVADMIVYEGFAMERALQEVEKNQLIQRCTEILENPDNYVEQYVVNGVPEKWSRYLEPASDGCAAADSFRPISANH